MDRNARNVERALATGQMTLADYAVAKRRCGVVFTAFYAAMVQAIEDAETAINTLSEDQWTETRQRQHEAGICHDCYGLGYRTVHVPSDRAMLDDGRRDCPHGDRQVLAYSEYHSTCDEIRAVVNREFTDRHKAARETRLKAEQALEPFWSAAKVEKGSRVALENTKARAYYSLGKGVQGKGDRVTVGTEGEIFWIGEGSYDGATKFGVRADDGRVFFTAATNLSSVSLNGWERIEQQHEAKAVYASTATLEKGDMIEIDGVTHQVFWIGADKKTGKQRFGAKRLAFTKRTNKPRIRRGRYVHEGEAVWGFSHETAKVEI